MLTEVKKQLNHNLRGLHLPTIRQCYEEPGQARGRTTPRPTSTTSMKSWSSRSKPGARIASFDIYGNRSYRWKRAGMRLTASDCPGRSTYNSTLCLRARSSTATRNLLAFGNPGSGKTHLLCAIWPRARPSGASRSVHDVLSLGAGTVVGETRAASRPSVETFREVPSPHHRRHRLRAARSRRDGGPVHAVGRALRTRQHHPHEQFAVFEMGEDLQGPHDDGPRRSTGSYTTASSWNSTLRAIDSSNRRRTKREWLKRHKTGKGHDLPMSRRNDRANRRRRRFRGLVHTSGTPFLHHLEEPRVGAARSVAPPPGADKDASHLFQSSAPSGAATERALPLCCYVTKEDE